MTEIEVRDAHGSELVDGCALLGRALGFSDRDALAPWLVQTSAAAGGLALAAFVRGRLAGFSFAMPGSGQELFSCGLAVDPAFRGRGIGRRLKLYQRERALALGIWAIRWTADPLAAPALALYLHGLGARLVDYAPGLYADVRPETVTPDDVLIEWPLQHPAPTAGRPSARVEIPLAHDALEAPALARWRHDVRGAMTAALETRAVGIDVAVDRSAGRAWVLFAEAS
jgi:predicted GNAT superfamily acetyltransferase